MVVMGNSSSLNKTDVLYGMKPFFDEYDLVHPGAVPNMSYPLFSKFSRIYYECSRLIMGYKKAVESHLITPWDDYKPVFWILYDERNSDLPSQLRSFIIKTHDLSLDHEDCALLFYISLQDENLQNSIQGIPLSILHEMFLPIAEENLAKWKQVS
jgi:hypothetical protein